MKVSASTYFQRHERQAVRKFVIFFFPALGKRLVDTNIFKRKKTIALFCINKAVKCKQSSSSEYSIAFSEVVTKSSLFDFIIH